MEITGFSSDGRVVFEFDQEMLIPDSLQNFTLKAEAIEPELQWRLPANETEQALVYLYNFMDFSVIRGSPNSAPMDDLIFTMLLVELSEKRLVLQAEF